MPRKVRQLGLHVALSTKLQSGLLRIVNDLGEAGWKGTRQVVKALSDDKLGGNVTESSLFENDQEVVDADEQERHVRFGHPDELSILFIAGPPSNEKEYDGLMEMARCVNNIPKIDVIPVEMVEAYEVLRRKWVVMDVRAVEWLGERAGEGWVGEELEGEGEGEVEAEGLETAGALSSEPTENRVAA
jgi:large subunit ribosomal protein L4